jgi:hypothetical protein
MTLLLLSLSRVHSGGGFLRPELRITVFRITVFKDQRRDAALETIGVRRQSAPGHRFV